MHDHDATACPTAGAAFGQVRRWLRAEGLLVAILCAAVYAKTESGWAIFALTFLAPDLALAAYLAGPRTGAAVYNAAHSYLGPLVVALAAFMGAPRTLVPAACVWAAHIGFDRLLGYGLKYPTGFGNTHLGHLGRAATRRRRAAPLRTAAPGTPSAG